MTDTITHEEVTYCAVHTDRETGLRCNKCGRLMCTECAVPTPVGYRCKECVRGVEDKFFTATQSDYLLMFAVSFGLAAAAAGICKAINLPLLFALLLGLPVGGLIAEAGLRITRKRRGRYYAQTATAGAMIGGLAAVLIVSYIKLQADLAQYAAAVGIEAPTPTLEILLRYTVQEFGALIFVGLIAVAVYGRYRMRL
jgi:hypothetical protein